MAKSFVCMDSDYDSAAQHVAEWRRVNVYPSLQTNGNSVTILKGNTATRIYLEQALKKENVVFFTGSGHGLYEEFQGSDGDSALEVGSYSPAEVDKKIIHLLSCNTAFELGSDTIEKGCLAFAGYDLPFTFHLKHMNEFMNPDMVFVIEIVNGNSVSEAHDKVMKEYDRMIGHLQKTNVHMTVIGDMMVNQKHFCSPVKDSRWGNPEASV